MRTSFVPLALVGFVSIGWTSRPVPAQEILDDGNMDKLTVGTNPDIGVPAGAWGFPQNYVDAGLAETGPGDLTIVETASFDPNRTGNSLRLDSTRSTGFTHLPNVFTRRLDEKPDEIIRVTFQIFVPGPNGGGSIYVGGDHGGGGYNNATDRGPQLTWRADGTIIYSPGNVVVVGDYPFEEWQTVRLDIDLVADRFDMYWAAGDDPLQQVGDDLPYRSGTQAFLDRFTYVHFSDLEFPAASYLDEVTVEVVGAATCRYRLKKDAKAKGGCQSCPLQGDVIASEDPCQSKEDCPKKFKANFACPDGPGTCKKVKGKRVGCE
ncbi:MAG: hypothetical protein C4547_15180 [Phycisphaerales bacterium]|nr:MAG: hypothetical protein C4547_15180 [Phycisphaerales bacterium]